MTCPKCNRMIDLDSRFCKHCGNTVPIRMPDTPTPGPSAAPAGPNGPAAPKPPKPARPNPATPLAPAPAASDEAGEQRLWQGRRSWRSYYGTWVMWLIMVATGIILIYKYVPLDSSLRIWVWGIAGASFLALFVMQALIVYGERYRLTSHRLFTDRGILSRVTDQTDLLRIDDVRIRQGISDRIFGTGNVEIIGSDSTDHQLILKSIDNPAEVAELLLKHVRIARSKKTIFVDQV